MKCRRLAPQRYQLKKEAAKIVATGHPWIFRSHLSTAADALPRGQWLKLVGPDNAPSGYGILDTEGLIGIRVLKRGASAPDPAWVRRQIEKALERRKPLREYTDAFRALHGENDGLPGVVVDVYGKTAVLQTYSGTVDTLGRYAAAVLAGLLGLENVIWKTPTKRRDRKPGPGVRVLRGGIPAPMPFREGKLTLTVDVGSGQKSGAFLDLRHLRKWIAAQPLKGKRVLNLFSYTGTLGLAAETAGAKEVWNVDVARGALDFAKRYHSVDPGHHRFIDADIFEWLGSLPRDERFDLIIVDPPGMAAESSQVPTALRAYRKLYAAALAHVAPRGTIVACCCTSRIARKRFKEEVSRWLAPGLRFSKTLLPEDDHPVGFPEGDYLKVDLYRS